MVFFKAEYNILIHQFYLLMVVGVFSCALFSAILNLITIVIRSNKKKKTIIL
ncbi:MAG: hypothetical protein ACQZ3M_06870 [cyanobacterium endosymbiont of Rhopalodia fuxianensis]